MGFRDDEDCILPVKGARSFSKGSSKSLMLAGFSVSWSKIKPGHERTIIWIDEILFYYIVSIMFVGVSR